MGREKIKLGQEVRDLVTGFTGIAVCRADWLFGCERIGLRKAGLDKDERPTDAEFFDEPGLVIVGPGILPDLEKRKVNPSPAKGPGGPNRECPRSEAY